MIRQDATVPHLALRTKYAIGLFSVWLHRQFEEAVDDNGSKATTRVSLDQFLEEGADPTLTVHLPDAKCVPETVAELSRVMFFNGSVVRIIETYVPSNQTTSNTSQYITQGTDSAEFNVDECFPAEENTENGVFGNSAAPFPRR